MKITLTVSKITKETIEIQTPAYFKEGNTIIKIVDADSYIKVHPKMFSFWNRKDYCFENDVEEFVTTLQPATDADFMNAYNNLIATISPLVNNAKCITQPA